MEISKQMKAAIDFMDEGFTFEDFKNMLEPHLKKKASSNLEKKTFTETLKTIFDIFDEDGILF